MQAPFEIAPGSSASGVVAKSELDQTPLRRREASREADRGDHESPLEEPVASRPRVRWERGAPLREDEDDLVVEEPLEIRLGGAPIAVIMRTPGHDLELATGFALTEQIVKGVEDLLRVTHCSIGEGSDNVVVLLPKEGADIDPQKFRRTLFTGSSCGICGKRTIARALLVAPPVSQGPQIQASVARSLLLRLRKAQPVFDQTGALHAAALFDPSGALICVREDIGRHNAVDKVIGFAARAGISTTSLGLLVSGRCSFEIVQKALAARLGLIISVGGVSSLAVDLASAGGVTLIGFARADSMNVYCHPERVV